MEVTWKTMLRLYAPYIAYGAVLLVGGIYAAGYRNGCRSILLAAAEASQCAR